MSGDWYGIRYQNYPAGNVSYARFDHATQAIKYENYIDYSNSNQYSDTLSVRHNKIMNSGSAISIRYNDTTGGTIQIKKDGTTIAKSEDMTFLENTMYDVEVIAIGGVISCSISFEDDDKKVMTVSAEETTYSSGGVAWGTWFSDDWFVQEVQVESQVSFAPSHAYTQSPTGVGTDFYFCSLIDDSAWEVTSDEFEWGTEYGNKTCLLQSLDNSGQNIVYLTDLRGIFLLYHKYSLCTL